MLGWLLICLLGVVLFVLGLLGSLTGANGRPWGFPVMATGVVLFVVGLAMLVGLALYYFCS